MEWTKVRDGLTLVMKKENLRVKWDLTGKGYIVERVDDGGNGSIIERGKAPSQPLDKFLHYIELTHGTGNGLGAIR